MNQAPVLTVTMAPAIDIVYAIRAAAKDIAHAQTRHCHAAGKGVNVARGLRDLNVPVHALTAGEGAEGEFLSRLLARERMDGTVLPCGVRVRLNATLEYAAGDELHVVDPSADFLPEHGDALFAQQSTIAARARVVAGHCPPPHGPTLLLQIAALRDVPLVVDTRDEALRAIIEADAAPWLLKPNEAELAAAVGETLHGEADVVRCARAVRARSGAHYVLVSRGTDPSVLVSRGGVWTATVPAVEVRNTVGAGDAMVAAICGESIGFEDDGRAIAMLKRAVAAGCANVTSSAPGAIPLDRYEALLGQVAVQALA